MKKCFLLAFSVLFLIQISCVSSFAFDTEEISIHGYVSQGYLKSDDNNYLANTDEGTFEFTEVGFNVSKKFDKLLVGFQILSRDLGEFGNNEIELDWALGEYHFKDYLGFRIGKIKMPLGLYNQERDVDMLRVPVLLPSSVYDEGSRDLVNTYQGVGLYGVVNLSVLGELDYELYYGSTDINLESIYIRGREEALASNIPQSTVSFISNNSEYMRGGALRWSLFEEILRLGFTYHEAALQNTISISSPIAFPAGPVVILVDLEMTTCVSSVEYTWYDLRLAAEYSTTKMSTSAGTGDKSMGWYLQANYRFNDKFSFGAYYSEFYPDKNDKDGVGQVARGNPDYAAWQKEIVPTLKFDFSEYLVVKGEVHFVDGVAQVYNFDNPTGREKDWTLYALKATFSF